MPNPFLDDQNQEKSLKNQMDNGSNAGLPSTPKRKSPHKQEAIDNDSSPALFKMNKFLMGRADKQPQQFIPIAIGFSPTSKEKFQSRLQLKYPPEVLREANEMFYTPSKGTLVVLSPQGKTHYRARTCYGTLEQNLTICVPIAPPPVLLTEPLLPESPVFDAPDLSEKKREFHMTKERVNKERHRRKREGKRCKKNKDVMDGNTAKELAIAAGCDPSLKYEFTHLEPQQVAGPAGQVKENLTVETDHANTQEYILESFGLAVGAEMAVHAKGIKNEVPQLREYTVTIKDDGVLPADTQKFLIDPLSNAQPTQFDATTFEVYQNTRLNAKKRKMAEAASKENQGLNVKQTFFQQKPLPSSPSFKKPAVALVARDEPSEFKGTFFKKEVATLPFVACSNSSLSLSIAQILSVPPRVDTCDFVV